MDPIFLHLRVNHFPIILMFVGAGACLLAAILRRDSVWNYALVTVVLAAITVPVAYWTGLRADDLVSGSDELSTVLDVGAMADHGESALWALIAVLAAGVAAGVALVKPKPVLRWIAVAVTLAAAGLAAYTGKQAGQIAHGEYTMSR